MTQDTRLGRDFGKTNKDIHHNIYLILVVHLIVAHLQHSLLSILTNDSSSEYIYSTQLYPCRGQTLSRLVYVNEGVIIGSVVSGAKII